eukprot:11606490-Ditylum_brightwellii.AAC.1
MTRDRFAFLWCHFHVYEDQNIEEAEDTTSEDDEGSGDDNLQEMYLERVQQEQDENEDEEESDDEEDNEEEKEDEIESKVWYFKLQKWIYHVWDASSMLIWVLGMYLSLNKTMMRFSGCSLETYRMKNKPIGEG